MQFCNFYPKCHTYLHNPIDYKRSRKHTHARTHVFKLSIFEQYLAISQKRCNIGTQLLWNANRNSYSLHPVAVSDPKLALTTPFSIFCVAIHIFVVSGDRDFKFAIDRLIVASAIVHEWQTIPGQVTWAIEILLVTSHISGTAVKFCTHVGYVKSQHRDNKSPLKGAWSWWRDRLKFCRPQWYLERLKLESSNFACR